MYIVLKHNLAITEANGKQSTLSSFPPEFQQAMFEAFEAQIPDAGVRAKITNVKEHWVARFFLKMAIKKSHDDKKQEALKRSAGVAKERWKGKKYERQPLTEEQLAVLNMTPAEWKQKHDVEVDWDWAAEMPSWAVGRVLEFGWEVGRWPEVAGRGEELPL